MLKKTEAFVVSRPVVATERSWTFLRPVVHRARFLAWPALACFFWLLNSPLAWAAKKKIEAPSEPVKSYVMPYFIVIVFLGMGLMTICRPSGRQEKVDQKKKAEKEDE